MVNFIEIGAAVSRKNVTHKQIYFRIDLLNNNFRIGRVLT